MAVPVSLSELVEDAIENIQDHGNCRKAKYVPSHKAFRVFKQDGTLQEIRLKGLHKIDIEEECQEDLTKCFASVVQSALQFLDGPELQPVLQGPSGPSQGTQDNSQQEPEQQQVPSGAFRWAWGDRAALG